MPTASQLMGWIKRVFDEREFIYDFDHETATISARFPLQTKLHEVKAVLKCGEDRIVINSYISLRADEECRHRVSEYLMRATYGLIFGNFELDHRDGEIRYRVTLDCEDRTDLSESLLMGSIGVATRMFNRYGDGLVAVMYGFRTPEEAVEEAEAVK